MSHLADKPQRNHECIERLRVAMKQTPYIFVPVFAINFGYVGLPFGDLGALILLMIGVVVGLRAAFVIQTILEWMALTLIAFSSASNHR